MQWSNWVDRVYKKVLSEKVKAKSEKIILAVAIASFLIHLLLIFLSQNNWLPLDSKFFDSPIAAIYTPFSFILVYEVYLLIFFLPKSISFYIGKQYEIITLIVIRRIFKDISHLELSSQWFMIRDDLQFTYDALTVVVLFALILLFYLQIKKSEIEANPEQELRPEIQSFVRLKKLLAIALVPVLMALALFTFGDWFYATLSESRSGLMVFKNINTIFFDEFFTLLIIVDVLLLLASFFYSDQFHKIIRNSGFVISTILIKLSFSTTGLVNDALVIGALVFGLLILLIHNQFERLLNN